jgi:hypothetical protein
LVPITLFGKEIMKIFSRSAVDDLGLAVLKKVLVYSTLCLTVVCGFLLIQLEEKYKFKPASVAAVIVIVSGLFVAFFSVPAVIERMKQDKGMFLRDAIAHTFYSYVTMGSFLPIVVPLVGRVLESKKRKNPFTSDGE